MQSWIGSHIADEITWHKEIEATRESRRLGSELPPRVAAVAMNRDQDRLPYPPMTWCPEADGGFLVQIHRTGAETADPEEVERQESVDEGDQNRLLVDG